MLDNENAPINKLLSRIKAVAEKGEGLELNAEDTALLAKHVADLFFIPVYDMDNIPLPGDTQPREPKEWMPM